MYTAQGQIDSQTLINDYMPLVRKQAFKLRINLPASVEVDDLIQAGMTGLLDALGRFDAKEGVSFATFASQRIRGAMIDELRSGDWLPRSVRRSGREIDACVHKLQQSLGRSPTEREVAEEMGLPLEKYQEILLDTNCGLLHSFENLVEENEGVETPDSGIDALIDSLSSAETKEQLIKAIGHLPEREKLLLALYYQEEMTLKEIAAVFEVSEPRISQLHSQALSRLRVGMQEESTFRED